MPNLKQIISNRNKLFTEKDDTTKTTTNTTTNNCNCRINKMCPLNGKCLTSGIVYQETVTRKDNGNEETYIGLTDKQFKTRYNAHTSSFRNEAYRNATSLSKYIWSLKDKGTEFNIRWRTISKCNSYSPSSKKCNLCLREKYYIIFRPNMASLNNRNELTTQCRHKKRYLLCNMNKL